jgi:hypothetical protein
MRTLLSAILSIALLGNAMAQKISMPSKGNNIVYDGTVKMSHNFNGDFVCSKLKSWVVAAAKEHHLNVQEMHDDACTITINAVSAIDKDGTFSDVDYSFKLVINITDGGLNYQLTNLVFNKAQHKYSANEVYAGYLQNEPFVKTALENKQAALRRHGVLLETLDKKINSLIGSFKTYMLQTGITN